MLPVVGWNETADRRQFCFISVLFHDVRRA